jgi:hypothetical protein
MDLTHLFKEAFVTKFSRFKTSKAQLEIDKIVSQLCMTSKSISENVATSIADLNEMYGEIEPLLIARALGCEQEFIHVLNEIVATAYLQLLMMVDGEVELFPRIVIQSSKGIVIPPLAPIFERSSVTELYYDCTFKDVRHVYGVLHAETSGYGAFLDQGGDVDIFYRNYIFSMIAKCIYRVAVELIDGLENRQLEEIIQITREQQFGNLLYFILENPITEFFEVIDEGFGKTKPRLFIGDKLLNLVDSEVNLEFEMASAFDKNFQSLFVEQLTEIINIKAL